MVDVFVYSTPTKLESQSRNGTSASVFHWNCAGLSNKRNELLSWLPVDPIPILALREGALPGNNRYVAYTAPSIPAIPHGSEALPQLSTLGFYPLLI